jgi:hypothetical protein|tara:strand:- start:526 stop:717 length:192 start_codon:yes stop_codon:yes gene_type:complete
MLLLIMLAALLRQTTALRALPKLLVRPLARMLVLEFGLNQDLLIYCAKSGMHGGSKSKIPSER